jgi:hypothetical protein
MQALSHVISSRPTVRAVFVELPATLEELIVRVPMSAEHVRNAVKLLLATKKAYVASWTVDVQPYIVQGNRPNVPRPTPDQTRYALLARTKQTTSRSRTEYQRQYRLANRDKRIAYMRENRDKLNEKRRQLTALKRALAIGNFVVEAPAPTTTWRF